MSFFRDEKKRDEISTLLSESLSMGEDGVEDDGGEFESILLSMSLDFPVSFSDRWLISSSLLLLSSCRFIPNHLLIK
jgi:hypothetical protein